MPTKREKFESVITKSFSDTAFVDFAKEFFTGMRLVAPTVKKKVYNSFNNYVEHYCHIGNYVGKDEEKVAVLTVCLKNEDMVNRSRGVQRNFVKQLMDSGNCAGAFVAFYTNGDFTKWRLSFVRLDYEFSKGKISQKLTPAKRFSYLVGDKEPCHTAMERLFPLFTDDTTNPGLDELEEAFSVEKVTKEFYEQYKAKYLALKEYLEDNEQFMSEAEFRGFTSEQFAKKLMGQIVFLYFIQKKGWLGVNAIPRELTEKDYKNAMYSRGQKSRAIFPAIYEADGTGKYRLNLEKFQLLSEEDETIVANCVKGRPWGSGPKDFMRQIFNACKKQQEKNYFDDYLEPLFYSALNQNRGENAYFPPMHRRIPFLNGGLFEQLDNYDWENNDFQIPNEIFSNEDIKGKRDADGILDIFDRYNFTMNEDEPLECEVAIDPEMLGKVFENLLDVKDRKTKGAFYTPREIVHYMCQETLINYLVTKSGIVEEDIRDFILYGDLMKDEDTTKDARDGNKEMLISEEIFNLKTGVNRIKELDDLLANVKVADLAVGSGAFPLGMLNEIVRARETLTAYMAIGAKPFDKKILYSNRKPYVLKVNTIKNCIFACDIEPSAVDIAKLRLWLSIVIDDELVEKVTDEGIFGEHTKPRQLPNLDCNIICGNSLIDEFMGHKLINESALLNNISDGRQMTIYQSGVDTLLAELIDLQDKLFFVKEASEKEELKRKINQIYNRIIMEQIQEDSELVEAYNEASMMNSKPFVIWQLYFPKVFRDNGGFDIVIGNPPYIQLSKCIDEETGEKLGDQFASCGYKSFARTGDIYCLFYEKGYGVLHKKGVLSFITSNKWMRSGYGKALRGFFAENTNPKILIDFAGQKIFESATVDVNILMFTKEQNQKNTLSCIATEACRDNLSVFVQQNSSTMGYAFSESWTILSSIEQSIKRKIEAVGTPLKDWNVSINYGIKTGLNEAFIISGEKKDELIAMDPKSAEIIRPILRGRDIKRYGYDFADLWLIATFPSRKYNIDDYPAVKKYLLFFGKNRLEQTGKSILVDGKTIKARKKTNNKWFETQDSINYWDDLSSPKIIWGEISDKPKFSIDTTGEYCPEATTFLMTGSRLKYLLAFLNSSFSEYFFAKYGTTTGMGTLRWKKYLIELLPIPTATADKIAEIEENIDDIINDYTDEKGIEIDKKIFKLLSLSNEEIDFIYNAIKKGAH